MAHVNHEKKSAESAHRLQQTNDAKKKNWHEKRNGKFLSGARRQREDAAVEEEGGASKLQGIGSPPRGGGLGIKKRVGTPKSILRNKAGNSASSSGGMSSRSNAGNQDDHANRDSQGTHVGDGVRNEVEGGSAAAGSHLNTQSDRQGQTIRRSTPGGPSLGANSKALSSQGLMPKSTSKGAQGARDSTRRGDEEDGNTTIGETFTARRNA